MIEVDHRTELSDVPFFPQDRYQCGPAALATVLVHSGVDITPARLVAQVYVPNRRGSFQIELKAATRSHGRLAYELPTDAHALFAELAGGNPVLVLQNLGFDFAPRWHYAVLIGYDPEHLQVTLRSGTRSEHRQRLGAFLRSWSLADNWALLTLKPGDLPAEGSPAGYVRAIAESEHQLAPEALSAALGAGLIAWPDNADLAFASGNFEFAQGQLLAAADHYRHTLTLQPEHVGALNNYADLLRTASCLTGARQLIRLAQDQITAQSPLQLTVLATADEIRLATAMGDIEGPLCTNLKPAHAVSRP